MLVIYPQGTTLSLQKAHWIQILHSACALARQPNVRVLLIPRTVSPATLETLPKQIGEVLPSSLTIAPLVEYSAYKKRRIKGNLLSEHQRFLTRLYGRKRFTQILAEHTIPSEPVILFTRDEEIPEQCARSLAPLQPLMINELHKLEYVNRLQGKIDQNKAKPLALKKYREFARREKKKEFQRLNLFHGVVSTTDNMSELLRRSGFQKPLCTIPNGTLLPETVSTTEALTRVRDLDVLYVGQLYRWKNVDLLLQALSHLPMRKLTVVGGKPGTDDWERLQRFANELGVANRVEFLGHQPHGLISEFMMRAKVGVVPLPQMGFPEARLFCSPLKAIEMMAAGTPIVASDLHSLRGLLSTGENALLVKPDDAEALAKGIEELSSNTILYETLITGALKTAYELSYSERAKRILQFAAEVGAHS
ncbi:MAG: glycosyltransferase family 4 protein [Sumerlaeia bacterium]